MKKFFRFQIVLITALALCACSPSGSRPGQSAVDITLKDLDGKTVNLADFKGRVVMLNFFATWCPPCKVEIPDFIELQNEHGPEGLSIVGISLDQKGVDSVKEFKRDLKINYTILYAGNQAQKIVEGVGGFRGIPTTFIINREGKIVKKFTGLIKKEAWEKEIRSLL
ncbi:MAG: TlpA disulfide reductase family protein [Thermodesulfobacteriota bacterium]|nr:TlpA disulfide reductase family protein [Thermodesulfobacteriota bacterium]